MSHNFTRQASNTSTFQPMNLTPPESKLTHNLSCNELSQKNFSFCNLTQTRLHFHLAGFVDIDNGTTLNLNNETTKNLQFNLHWLNNKNLNFTLASEAFFAEIRKNQSREETALNEQHQSQQQQFQDDDVTEEKEIVTSNDQTITETSKNLILTQIQDQRLDKIIKDWYIYY